MKNSHYNQSGYILETNASAVLGVSLQELTYAEFLEGFIDTDTRSTVRELTTAAMSLQLQEVTDDQYELLHEITSVYSCAEYLWNKMIFTAETNGDNISDLREIIDQINEIMGSSFTYNLIFETTEFQPVWTKYNGRNIFGEKFKTEEEAHDEILSQLEREYQTKSLDVPTFFEDIIEECTSIYGCFKNSEGEYLGAEVIASILRKQDAYFAAKTRRDTARYMAEAAERNARKAETLIVVNRIYEQIKEAVIECNLFHRPTSIRVSKSEMHAIRTADQQVLGQFLKTRGITTNSDVFYGLAKMIEG